jgi:uncharacterized protein (TIGR03437 family)
MTRTIATFVPALLLCAATQAATISTTLTVTNATATLGASLVATGPAALTNGIGNGTFSATISLTTFSGPYTITVPAGTITGTITVSGSILTGVFTASATITGGTGTYAGATGSFPNLAGTLSATSFLLNFSGAGTVNTGGTVGPTPPGITDVLDAGSNTPNVAQGTIFIVKGTNLCPSGTTFFNVPRPTVAPDGVKITFTPVGGGAATDALLWYEYNPSGVCQLAGILQSTVAPGSYNVTVTNGSVSAPVATQVLQRKFALLTEDATGTGQVIAQEIITPTRYDRNRLTTGTFTANGFTIPISPAHPGQPMVVYGTGLGPLASADNSASPIYDFTANGVSVTAIVGGVTIPVAYAGLAGFAGEDQVNFTLPANVPTGCSVSLQILVNGTLTSPTSMAIAPPGATECVQPGFTSAQLKNFDQGGTYTLGFFYLAQLLESLPSIGAVTVNSASGNFTQYTGFQLSSVAQYTVSTSTSGACSVTHITTSGSTTTAPSGLDAGTITLNGPPASNISNLPFQQDPLTKNYSLTLATTGLPGGGTGTIVAGQYALSGAGGKDVGKFSSSVTVGSPVNLVGGLPAVVNRNVGLPFTWTGGNANDLVEIEGISDTTTGTGTTAVTDLWTFVCTTAAGAGSFTVPPSVLQQLPAATLSANGSGGGILYFLSSVAPSTFTAPLTAGGNIDSGTFLAFVGVAGHVIYQ